MFTQSCLHSSTCLLLGVGAYLLPYTATLVTVSRYTLLLEITGWHGLILSHQISSRQDLSVSTISRTPFKQRFNRFYMGCIFPLTHKAYYFTISFINRRYITLSCQRQEIQTPCVSLHHFRVEF